MCKVIFEREKLQVEVAPGQTILEAEITAGLQPDAPCGGRGSCGKCMVYLGKEQVLACQTPVYQDIQVRTALHEQKSSILTESLSRPAAFLPDLRCRRIALQPAQPGDISSDWERLEAALGQSFCIDSEMASSVWKRMQKSEDWYAVYTQKQILELSEEPVKMYVAAFDLGTTTVVGYLLRAEDGKTVGVASRKNPQVQFGADVISRANYALEHGVQELSICIRSTVNDMLQRLAKDARISMEQIGQICAVGNTCMHHLFLGVSPASLVHAPYSPVIRAPLTLNAADYGLCIHPKGELLFLPNIAGFVGADTCGCLLAVRPDKKEEMTLLIDIGTNGEMVLGNRDGLVACSTAAGPAFEGAKIACGMRGSAGAVDHVRLEHGQWSFTTIGEAPACGLCGSGLIDLAACLYLDGRISETGRLCSGQKNPSVFVLTSPQENGAAQEVYLTQNDVSELQLAKAAIAAGIRLLCRERGIGVQEIARVYIAGAFGNYLSPASACVIGMIPKELEDRIVPIGNAAGEGARLALLCRQERKEIEELIQSMGFLELAASEEFQDCYVEELCFPEKEG